MKRNIFLLAALLIMSLSAKAMSYDRATFEAKYLTDKMAYEMGFSSREYNKVYRINLDYFLSINHPDNLYTSRWHARNSAFRIFFSDRQWNLFIGTNYFYRPVSWHNGTYVYNVYTRYPRHDNGLHRGYYKNRNRIHGQDRWRTHDDVYVFGNQSSRKDQKRFEKQMRREHKHHNW